MLTWGVNIPDVAKSLSEEVTFEECPVYYRTVSFYMKPIGCSQKGIEKDLRSISDCDQG